MCYTIGPDRLVVRTLRCGRNNPGSNPGLDITFDILDNTASAIRLFTYMLNMFFPFPAKKLIF